MAKKRINKILSGKEKTHYKKSPLPKALREQVWIKHIGKSFEAKCPISWCENRISVFDFQVGHNIPESKGGKSTLENLLPICSRCNLSMANNYTIDDWNTVGKSQTPQIVEPQKRRKWWCCCF
jgi:5-methylcytosine-specific restriction endonuclease McrA